LTKVQNFWLFLGITLVAFGVIITIVAGFSLRDSVSGKTIVIDNQNLKPSSFFIMPITVSGSSDLVYLALRSNLELPNDATKGQLLSKVGSLISVKISSDTGKVILQDQFTDRLAINFIPTKTFTLKISNLGNQNAQVNGVIGNTALVDDKKEVDLNQIKILIIGIILLISGCIAFIGKSISFILKSTLTR
jgi:hypothetical protein